MIPKGSRIVAVSGTETSLSSRQWYGVTAAIIVGAVGFGLWWDSRRGKTRKSRRRRRGS